MAYSPSAPKFVRDRVRAIRRVRNLMFNPRASSPGISNRSLLIRHDLGAAFRARRQSLPAAPASLWTLLDHLQHGMSGLLGRAGARDGLLEICAGVYRAPGREAEARSMWHDALAAAVFAARLAQLRHASVAWASCAALLHRAGESLALGVLARVELEHRMQLDGKAQREWCSAHGPELLERLTRAWQLPAEVAAGIVGWQRFGEFAAVSAESAMVYFGRLSAIQLRHPEFLIPGAVEQAHSALGLSRDALAELRREDGCVLELIRSVG